MPPPTPSLDSLSPLTQVVVLIGGAVAGALAWMFGSRNQGGEGSDATIIQAENDKLRRDLETVLASHREALEARFEKFADENRKDLRDLSERMRQAELSVARLETRSKH